MMPINFPAHHRDTDMDVEKKKRSLKEMIIPSKKGAIFPKERTYVKTLYQPVEKFPFHTMLTHYADKGGSGFIRKETDWSGFRK